ncbi:hypothetical protein ACVMAJ_001372 [Bradyrhizobium sp. USDA 4448]
MTAALGFVFLAVLLVAASLVLMIREIHVRALDTRVSNAVLGIPNQSPRSQGLVEWFSAIGVRYRRFYADENLEQLRTILQSAGFNHHRTLPIWIGVKIVSMISIPLVTFFVAQISGKPPVSVLIYTFIGVVLGVMGPRLILLLSRRRFDAAIRLGTPDTIDLLVVCSEAGMGLWKAP